MIDHKAEIMKLLPVEDMSLTGSRLFGDATGKSDWDYIVLTTDSLDNLFNQLVKNGEFVVCGEYDEHSGEWLIIRREEDNLNLIITTDRRGYGLWRKCNRFALSAELSKEVRGQVFHLVVNN